MALLVRMASGSVSTFFPMHPLAWVVYDAKCSVYYSGYESLPIRIIQIELRGYLGVGTADASVGIEPRTNNLWGIIGMRWPFAAVPSP